MAKLLSYELKCCVRAVGLLCSAILLATASAAQNIGTLPTPEPTDTQSAATSGSNEVLMFVPSTQGVTAVPVYLGEAKPAHTNNRAPFDTRRRRSQEYWNALGKLIRSHQFQLRPERLKVYSNFAENCPFSNGDLLIGLFEQYADEIQVAIPVTCILPHRLSELTLLASKGNLSAQVALLSLTLELRESNPDEQLNLLLEISDAGFGPASIAAGNYFLSRSDRARAVERYELAGSQDILNYELYIRSVGTVPPPLLVRER